MYYVYILQCLPDMLYTGITKNPSRRLRQHLGLLPGGAKFTAMHRPVSIAALWQVDTRSEALRFEAGIKKLKRPEKDAIVSGVSFHSELVPQNSVRLDPDLFQSANP